MQTFYVKVRPHEKVKQSKRNGEWIKRYKVPVPDGLEKEDVLAILKPYVNPKYAIFIIPNVMLDKVWESIENKESLQSMKALLKDLELFYYKKDTKRIYNTIWAKIAEFKVSSCFDVSIEEHTYFDYRMAFFHITPLADDVKHVPNSLLETLEEQKVKCRVASNGHIYMYTMEQLPFKDHFRLTKSGDEMYTLEKCHIEIDYLTGMEKVPF